MGAETAGKKLGIGLRLAGRAVWQRAAEATVTANPSSNPSRNPAQTVSSAARAYVGTAAPKTAQAATAAKGVARGAKKFGEAIWGPMAHTGGVLWLEITGLFFFLFALFFAQNVYKFRHDYAGGPEHPHFLVYAALTALFGYFTFSSFYSARRKEKKNRARRAQRS